MNPSHTDLWSQASSALGVQHRKCNLNLHHSWFYSSTSLSGFTKIVKLSSKAKSTRQPGRGSHYPSCCSFLRELVDCFLSQVLPMHCENMHAFLDSSVSRSSFNATITNITVQPSWSIGPSRVWGHHQFLFPLLVQQCFSPSADTVNPIGAGHTFLSNIPVAYLCSVPVPWSQESTQGR